MKRDYLYLIVIIILTGMGLFSAVQNREHKQNIKALTKDSQRKQVSIDSLKASVAQRDKADSVLVSQIKSLYITTTDAKPGEIIHMDADSFLLLLKQYIDSAGKATN